MGYRVAAFVFFALCAFVIILMLAGVLLLQLHDLNTVVCVRTR